MAYFVGTAGDVTFNSIALRVTSWTFDDDATEIETTNKASGGFYTGTTGKRKGTFTFEASWDGGDGEEAISYGDPPVVQSGTVAAIELELSDGGDSISCASATIQKCSYKHDLDGVFSYSGSGYTSGEYFLPGESTS